MKKWLVLAWMIVILFYVNTISSCSNSTEITQVTPTPTFSEKANEIFISTISKNKNLNSGITIERSIPISSNNININSVTFAVFNHTDEAVTFPNQGFGLLIFGYDEDNENWEKLDLHHYPSNSPKILEPKFEKWDDHNMWDVLANDLETLPYKRLRFFICGIGNVTITEYCAYLDVSIGMKR